MPQPLTSSKSVLSIAAGLLLCGAAALGATAAWAAPSSQARSQMMPMAGHDRCINIPARAAARMAYLQTRLELSTAQAPLFTHWKDIKMTAAKQMEAKCDAHFKNGENHAMRDKHLSPVDRLTRTEARLQQRLADIRAERPALSALYASLSDEQKARFGRSDMRGMHSMRGMHHGMMMRHGHAGMHPSHGGQGGAPGMAPAP